MVVKTGNGRIFDSEDIPITLILSEDEINIIRPMVEEGCSQICFYPIDMQEEDIDRFMADKRLCDACQYKMDYPEGNISCSVLSTAGYALDSCMLKRFKRIKEENSNDEIRV